MPTGISVAPRGALERGCAWKEAGLAIPLGDPRGIGPEVAFEAVSRGAAEGSTVTFLGAEALRQRVPEGCRFVAVGQGGDGDARRDTGSTRPPDWTDLRAGRVSLAAIKAAVRGALAGEFAAIVTAPVHKPSLRAAGLQLPGQTELLAELSGTTEVGMLMAAEKSRLGGPLRILLATTHHPLSEVPRLATRCRLVRQCSLLDRSLRDRWGIAHPRIALCALNPHASDRGLFGHEEASELRPAVDELRASGIEAHGPVSADTVFVRALAGRFDAVVAPYHDVGMAAFKTVAFGTGVNVTLGLPFVRTSPDHGTAFDIAGEGSADASSMIEALRLALRLARGTGDGQ